MSHEDTSDELHKMFLWNRDYLDQVIGLWACLVNLTMTLGLPYQTHHDSELADSDRWPANIGDDSAFKGVLTKLQTQREHWKGG